MPEKACAICFILFMLIILGMREDQIGIRTYIYGNSQEGLCPLRAGGIHGGGRGQSTSVVPGRPQGLVTQSANEGQMFYSILQL